MRTLAPCSGPSCPEHTLRPAPGASGTRVPAAGEVRREPPAPGPRYGFATLSVHPRGRAVQPRLAVGPAGDAFEREADRVAASVLRAAAGGPRSAQPLAAGVTPLGRGPAASPVGRADAAGPLESGLSAARGGGSPLAPEVRAFMEPRMGVDFGRVRVHTDARAARLNRGLGALAFTHGHDIYYGAGRAPGNDALTAHELTHVVQQAGAGPHAAAAPGVIQMMRACPPRLGADEATPTGWQSYHGNAAVFHCGFRGILEDRIPTPEDPQNECFYDHSGALVDQNHPYAGCGGTPNQYDSADSPVRHTVADTGGILYAGAPAFITSRVYDVVTAVNTGVRVVSAATQVMRSIGQGFSDAVALGVLTGIAVAEPGNWTFQGLPQRSRTHLRMMGAILTSAGLAATPETMLRNLTRRLGSFAITGLLDDIAADINQAQEARGPTAPRVTAAQLAELSMVQLVEFLRTQTLLQFVTAPEEIARIRLAEARAAAGTP
jgi:Domain of unknown function (DUF4157)